MSGITSLKQLKERAQFFKAGSIIPTRIFRNKQRKMQHKLKFGSNAWAIPTRKGYLVLIELPDTGGVAIRCQGHKFHISLEVNGSPYHPKGSQTQVFYGTSEQLLDNEKGILDKLALMNSWMPLIRVCPARDPGTSHVYFGDGNHDVEANCIYCGAKA